MMEVTTLLLMSIMYVAVPVGRTEFWDGVRVEEGDTTLEGLHYVCYPNSSIVVDNPNTGGFRTSFANGTSGVCNSIYNDEFTSLTITDCPLNQDILLVFTNRTEDYDAIIGGPGVDAYILRCNLNNSYVSRAFTQGFTPSLSAATVTSITPTMELISALRRGYSFDSEVVKSAVLTTKLYWTIDVNVEYFSLPTLCTVYSGPVVSSTALNKTLIIDGCSQDLDLVGNFGQMLSSAQLQRNWASFRVFKFYDSDYITIECMVKYCRNFAECFPPCLLEESSEPARRRRGRESPNEPAEYHRASTTLKIVDGGRYMFSSAPTLGATAALLPVLCGLILL